MGLRVKVSQVSPFVLYNIRYTIYNEPGIKRSSQLSDNLFYFCHRAKTL